MATPLALQAAPEGVTQVDLGKAKVSMINDGVYARPLADSVVKVQPGDEVVPGIRALDAAGHTPGHTAYMIDGGKRKLLYWADTTNIAIFVRNPDWSVQFDMDAEKARETRRRIADLAIREKALVGGFHLPGSAVGELKAKGNGCEFTPLK